MKTKYTEEQKQEVRKLADNGLPQREISNLTGVPIGTLSSLIYGKKKPKPVMTFKKYPTEVLAKVVDLRNRGLANSVIARQLSLPPSTASAIFHAYKDNPPKVTLHTKAAPRRDIDALFELQAEYVWKFIEPKLDEAIENGVRAALKKVLS